METSSNHVRDFLGKYSITLDDKRRIVMPADWRKTIEARNPPGSRNIVYATTCLEHALDFIILLDVRGYEQARNSIISDECYRLKIDAKYRLLLPQELAGQVGLDTELILAASRDKDSMRIWNPQKYSSWEALCRKAALDARRSQQNPEGI